MVSNFDWELLLAMRVHTKTGLLLANTIHRLNGVVLSTRLALLQLLGFME